jgi:hypothetical protein
MTESEIIQQLRQRNSGAFKALIGDYSEDMLVLAYLLTDDATRANEVVSDLLYKIWIEGPPEELVPPLHVYLYAEVRKACQEIDPFKNKTPPY